MTSRHRISPQPLPAMQMLPRAPATCMPGFIVNLIIAALLLALAALVVELARVDWPALLEGLR